MIRRYLLSLVALLLLAAGPAWGQVVNVPGIPPNSINVQSYGAIGDFTAQTSGGVTTASSTAFSNTGGITFGGGDVGKKITIYGAGANGNNLTTTISAVSGSSATLAASASYSVSSSTSYLGSAAVSAAGTGYVPGDTIGFTAGTYATAAQVTVAQTQVVSATVNAGGSSCTGSTAILLGTTGTGTKFTATVPISGGAISGAVTITSGGYYTTNPTTLASEPVTGSSCSGATLTVVMGVARSAVSFQGSYSVTPGNPVSQASTSGSGTGATFTMTWLTAGSWNYWTDNATAIQNAINAAQTASKALYIPSTANCYGYTAPLNITASLAIVGDFVQGNWNNGINVPLGTPALLGSVICPSANGSNALQSTATSPQINISNIGILFQTTFGQGSTSTGDAINVTPSSTNQGLSSQQWNNVMIFGHDGNHYGVNLKNAIYGYFTGVFTVGGGALKQTTSAGNFGNQVWIDMLGQVVVGGSANGVDLSADAAAHLNLITFIRPQVNINNTNPGVITPLGNLPYSNQFIWKVDTNTREIGLKCPDLETNVNSSVTLASPVGSNGNDFDPNCSFFNLGTGTIKMAAWGDAGPFYSIPSLHWTDTTSSGTVASTSMLNLNSQFLTASSATTYTAANMLTIGTPQAGTNVTITSNRSILASGEIRTTADLSSGGGMFVNGTTQINTNNNGTTEIGDGSTSSAVTIGGTSNTTNLSSAAIKMANLPTDATHTDRTVCEDTTTFQLYFGSGTLGICLGTSSARYKHDIAPLDAGLAQIAALKPVKYKLNADHGDPNKLLYGFTAEQGSKVLPALSDKDAEGKPNTFDYVGVVPVLVKAVQELKADNDNLRASIRKLRYPKRH